MSSARTSGVLLHPTSLPGPCGIGDFGPGAHQFIDWLADADCGLWQILPLGPTGYGNSPYQCHSVFALNELLISPEVLVTDGYLSPSDVAEDLKMRTSTSRVDYADVIDRKRRLLRLAFDRFLHSASQDAHDSFRDFQVRHSSWLADYCLFRALKRKYHGARWLDWPEEHLRRSPSVLAHLEPELRESAEQFAFLQMLAHSQWSGVLSYAHDRGLRIVGDVPIFAAEDSADVWSNPELFCLDEMRRPTVVAGVPPDYFSATGQLWGNPLYRWDVHEETRYAWWIERLRAVLSLVDLVRLDHFRGLAAYWEVPAGSPTAEFGRWLPGPGASFLAKLVSAMTTQSEGGTLPLIAEDLGVVTPDVRALLTDYELPGMRILQFGLVGHYEDFLPHNYVQNCVAYTGTHDNDTARGWFESASSSERRFALSYLGSTEGEVVADMVRALWASAAERAIIPIQDLLDLGSESRMNFPGTGQGNWEWRLDASQLTAGLRERLAGLNREFRRSRAGQD